MKENCRLSLLGAALVLLLIPAAAVAQRTFVERPGASIGVRHAGDWRTASSLNHLNREVREVQLIAGSQGRLPRIARVTDRLNYDYHRRRVRPWVIHRRAEALRSEIRAIRSRMRPRGWR